MKSKSISFFSSLSSCNQVGLARPVISLLIISSYFFPLLYYCSEHSPVEVGVSFLQHFPVFADALSKMLLQLRLTALRFGN